MREERLLLMRQQPESSKLEELNLMVAHMDIDQSFYDCFMGEFNSELKKDFSAVDRLSNMVFEKVVDRDYCLKGVSNEILRRWLLTRCIGYDRRYIERYIGFQAPPGGGKSRLMDYIAVLKGAIMDHVDCKKVYEGVKLKLQRYKPELYEAIQTDVVGMVEIETIN